MKTILIPLNGSVPVTVPAKSRFRTIQANPDHSVVLENIPTPGSEGEMQITLRNNEQAHLIGQLEPSLNFGGSLIYYESQPVPGGER